MKQVLITIYKLFNVLKKQYNYNLFSFLKHFSSFLKDYKNYKRLALMVEDSQFVLSTKHFFPCLTDKTEYTPVEPIYFYQDTWAAAKLFEIKPTHHYDVGSSVKTIGIISQFTPVTMIDIRPIDLKLKNLHFQKGSITALPFENDSIESISSLCVVEHIGLGRYGDDIDPKGSEKAIRELKRVVARGGHLLISVPVDDDNRIYFNAHRAFTREYILELFNDMKLIEEKYIYQRELYNMYDKTKGFGTGLFYFRKV